MSDKFTLKKTEEGYEVLLRRNLNVICPLSASGKSCGTWCPHFDKVSDHHVTLNCFDTKVSLVPAK